MEHVIDQQEQYSRHPNLRVHGLPETGDVDDATAVVMTVRNNKMSLKPPIERHQIERIAIAFGRRLTSRAHFTLAQSLSDFDAKQLEKRH